MSEDDTRCREMETRTCPPAYAGPCGDRPCARFESDDPTPWESDTTIRLEVIGKPFRGSLARALGKEGDTTMSEDDTTIPNPGIGDDVRLSIECAAGPLLNTTLIMAAVAARYRMAMTVDGGPGEILPFLYRDPFDPEEPDAPRPLRRAVLAIVDDKIVEHDAPKVRNTHEWVSYPMGKRNAPKGWNG